MVFYPDLSYSKKQYFKGRKAEHLFCKLTGAEDACSSIDASEHTDAILDGKSYDIKGLRRSHKKGYILVEFSNVAGNLGWCNDKGLPDKIAFQFPEGFLVVDNAKLYQLSKKVLINKPLERRNGIPCTQAYRLLGRKDRLDEFMYLRKEDIMPIVENVIPT